MRYEYKVGAAAFAALLTIAVTVEALPSLAGTITTTVVDKNEPKCPDPTGKATFAITVNVPTAEVDPAPYRAVGIYMQSIREELAICTGCGVSVIILPILEIPVPLIVSIYCTDYTREYWLSDTFSG